ncbi:hypothetical protein HEP89_15585 [Labrenzia sp. 5N]|uniref:hypothetical protein n=1 Tax=Labrenzia sp. 5N TaxID=2723402 RepID=UPI001445598C|nr:hypothetical protein [Labrenzia sp. 5N]NKX65543.1 hypothetical protein [Labrenzia sp. 5N]
MLRLIAREPLVHFVVLGGLLFAAWSWLVPQQKAEPGDEVIILDQTQMDYLETLWKAQWKREPSHHRTWRQLLTGT